jgi:uncharacterized integral membrane protein (TIGR00697 family)
MTQHRLLWLRASGSTVVSQLVDTVIITFIAWTGLLDISSIGHMIVSSYILKVLIAVGLTPVIYAGHAVIERLLSAAIEEGRAETVASPAVGPEPPAR